MTGAATVILNVDDNDANRYVKSRILRRAGYEVFEAANVAGALKALAEHPPDLVLLDVRLPDGNGRDLCARIKSEPSMAQVLVLQTSASHIESRHRVASLDAGADGYLVEPIEPEELIANVRALLRLRQAEFERQAALEALRVADRRKDEFLAMLAHELRNPLAPIRNAVEVMRRTQDAAVHAKARELIGRQADHLSRLVDDLLEVSRITSGKLVPQKRVARLAGIVDVALEVARPLAQAAEQRLEARMPAEDLWIEADAVRMSQVISNLLHNATKFTPRGGRIALEVERGTESLDIAVTDDGIGIPAELLDSVFELFSQADRSLDRAQGGLGIGLSLARGLVQMHGGRVTALSEGPGRGARFVVHLPLNLLREPPAAATPEGPSVARSRRVLLVEDNLDSAEAMRLLLRQLGHEVHAVNDGALVERAAGEFLPDVILLDIGLPSVDGYELARRLRRRPDTRAARIIAVTGYGQPSDRALALESGFDDHLVKPVDPEQLASAVASPA